jgi:molecular chaperone DnaK
MPSKMPKPTKSGASASTLKNQADSLAYQAEKQLADMGDKVPAADKEKAEGQIKELKAAVLRDAQDNKVPITIALIGALLRVGGASP